MTLPTPALSSVLGMLAVVVVAAAVALAMRARPATAVRRFEAALAAANVLLLIASKAVEARLGFASWAWLPLHVCDVSSVAGALALLQGGRVWRATTLYFGVGLSTFALLFPDLADGPFSIAFWVFWLRHAAIMVTGLYDLIARGYRPTWSDYGRWCALGGAYVAVVSVVNALAHTNFAFIANQTLAFTPILESFGPWPTRSAIMLALAMAHAAAITLLVQSLPASRRFDPRPHAPP